MHRKVNKPMKLRRLAIAVTAVTALLVSACGSSNSGSGSPTQTPAPGTTSAADSTSSAPSGGSTPSSAGQSGSVAPGSSQAPADDPNLLKGKVVWYADILDSNPLVTAIAQALNDKLTANGATMVRSFAINNTTGQLDLGVQAEAMNRALAAKPAAIAYFLADPKALKPQVQRAREAGIPVYAAFGKPDGFDVDGYIGLDDEKQGYLSAKYLADHLPKGAKVALITGPPTPNVNAEMVGAKKALDEAGVTIVGDEDQQRNLTDNSDGGKQIMQGILQRVPDVQGVFVYNDDSAIGAISAAKAANKNILFTSRNASVDGVNAVKAGTLLATCDIDPIALGHELGQAIVDRLAGRTQPTVNAQLPSPDASNCIIDKDNVANWKPYQEQIKYQNIKTG